MSKRELHDAIWSRVVVGDASLPRAVTEARRAIGDVEHKVIVTVRGRGYRFAWDDDAPTHPESSSESDNPFVGREAHMGLLEKRLDDAFACRGNGVWISGEDGIGKTRLLHEASRAARSRGALVLTARATAADGAPELRMWSSLIAAAGDRLEGGAALALALATPPPATDAKGRFHLFEAVVQRVLAAAQREPLVVCLDDLHLAGTSQLDLLERLARETCSAKILLLGAFRDRPLPEHASAFLLGTLAREYTSTRIHLRGLSEEDIGRLLHLRYGPSVPPRFVAAIHERSAGNPFYLNELLETSWADGVLTRHTALASSIDLRPALTESIGRHLAEVSHECRDVLSSASVLGCDFAVARLSATTQLDPRVVLDRIDEAMRAQLVAKGAGLGHVRFVPALVRDVLYKGLSGARRALLHLKAGEALLESYGDAADTHADELSRHFLKAAAVGGAARGVRFAKIAARSAERSGAHAEAARRYEEALSALPASNEHGAEQIELLLALARVRLRANDTCGASQASFDAATLAFARRVPGELVEAILGFVPFDGVAGPREELLAEARAWLAEIAPLLAQELDLAIRRYRKS